MPGATRKVAHGGCVCICFAMQNRDIPLHCWKTRALRISTAITEKAGNCQMRRMLMEQHAVEGNGEGYSAREPARGITHACFLCLSAIAIHACSERRELSIRAPSASATERVASFRAVLPPTEIKSSNSFLAEGLFSSYRAGLKQYLYINDNCTRIVSPPINRVDRDCDAVEGVKFKGELSVT